MSWTHHWPLFDLVFGFAACAAIVWLSKGVGKAFLQRREDYWEKRAPRGRS